MKKTMLTTIATLAICSSSTVFAAGLSYSGQVDVFTSGTRQYMQANMSVRHNTSVAGSPYVSFAGRDSAGEYFSCYVLTTSPLYDAAVAIKNNFTNGGRLYIYKQTSSNECENLSLGNYSYYLD